MAIICEVHISVPTPAVIWCDNIGANSLTQNPVFHAKTKHIDIDTHFIREKVSAGIVEPRYVPTEFQVADILTKGLLKEKFHFFCSKLTLVNSPQFNLRGDVSDNKSIAQSSAHSKSQKVDICSKEEACSQEKVMRSDQLNDSPCYYTGFASSEASSKKSDQTHCPDLRGRTLKQRSKIS